MVSLYIGGLQGEGGKKGLEGSPLLGVVVAEDDGDIDHDDDGKRLFGFCYRLDETHL